MKIMDLERRTLEEFLPGLDAELAGHPLAELEQRRNPGIDAFKRAGGPALVVPAEHGGFGADPVQAVLVQRAIGSRSPSLAVATTMHHFSVASMAETGSLGMGFEWMMLEAVAKQRLLVASGFAEGRTGQAILSPSMTARVAADGVRISGRKKPCSLSGSMDLLTASVSLPREGGSGAQMAVALIPSSSPGMKVVPFWNSHILAGAESDEVILDDVLVPPNLIARTEITAEDTPDALQTAGFLWFELLMSASYLGMATALVEQVMALPKISTAERSAIVVEIESAMSAVVGVARGMKLGLHGEAAFAESLVCRFAVQDSIGRAVRASVEALGGMAYIQSGDVAYLASCTAALAFHPPSRSRMSEPIFDYFSGQPLRVG